MITQDKIAAATLAQIFGSELKRVDENTTAHSSTTVPAVRIDPKRILVGGNQNQNSNLTAEQRNILAAVNAEAAASYPRYDEPSESPALQVPQQIPQQIPPQELPQQTLPSVSICAEQQNQLEFSFPPPGSPGFELFEKINNNLERIARAIENFNHTQQKQGNSRKTE